MTAETPGPALLVVDDNEDNRYTLVQRLHRLGYTNVVTAIDGRGALERLGTQDFDLVLLDVMMPELNGYEVLERMRGDERLRHIPVIMISAVDLVESVVRCIELGAEDYLPKPFNPTIVRARVATSLEKKRLRDQELRYLEDVGRVTRAAAAVEATKFEAGTLSEVERRPDELGQLARVFVRMAGEVAAREAKLRQEIQTLRIEIDESQKVRQVSEITETEYFCACGSSRAAVCGAGDVMAWERGAGNGREGTEGVDVDYALRGRSMASYDDVSPALTQALEWLDASLVLRPERPGPGRWAGKQP